MKTRNKIREQSKAVMVLSAEKETLLEQVTKLQKSYNRVKIELEEKAAESDKLSKVNKDEDLKTKEAAIEDLHHRLKSNIDNIHKLNQQLSYIQKDNLKLRSEL
ncbi:hypothetical protein Btru_065908 [Bulinus truncatus]|nr:hypothetical protein Btru_065908 [Bulinus truncatus]